MKRGRGGRGDKLEKDDGEGQCDRGADEKNECIKRGRRARGEMMSYGNRTEARYVFIFIWEPVR